MTQKAKAPAQPRGLGRVKSVEDLKTDTLVGDVRDLVLQEMRDAKEALPWTTRTEKQQAEMIDRADRFARNIVTRIVNLVAAGDNPAVATTIEKWGVGSKGLSVVLNSTASQGNLTAMMEGGNVGFLVFADKEPYQGEREPVKPVPAQGDLIEDDGDADPGED